MMRRNLAALPLILNLVVAQAADDTDKTAPPPANAAAAVGEEHRRLAELAGTWSVKQSLWLNDAKVPQIDAGTAVFSAVLGGRHLQQDLRVRSNPPFQGLGFTGYDNTTRRYYTSWMDINFTGVLLLHGDYDAAAKVYRFSGAMAGAGGESVPTREELQILDRNHIVARFFETRHGRETLVVELDYSRP
jgi:hypothetical protein